LRPVSPRRLYGCGDLRLIDQAVHIPERKQNVLQLPGLAVEVFRTSGIEVSDGEEELG
jgi:hypothetical protein